MTANGLLRVLLACLLALAMGVAAVGCGDDDDPGGGSTDPETVAQIRAAAEGATGLTLAETSPPEGAGDAGIGAVLTSGPDGSDGQRLVVSIGIGDDPNDIDEGLKAELGSLAGIDVTASSSPLGWGSRVAKSSGAPVYIVYLAEATTRDELERIDRSDELKAALEPYGFED